MTLFEILFKIRKVILTRLVMRNFTSWMDAYGCSLLKIYGVYFFLKTNSYLST